MVKTFRLQRYIIIMLNTSILHYFLFFLVAKVKKRQKNLHVSEKLSTFAPAFKAMP